MTNTRPLLIAYDGSTSARTADEQTTGLFPGAQTIVLNARQPLEGLAAEGRVSSSMQTASAASEHFDEELDAAVVILGTRRRGGVRSALLDSTSTNVLNHTERPTLVIPSQDVVLDRQEVQRRN